MKCDYHSQWRLREAFISVGSAGIAAAKGAGQAAKAKVEQLQRSKKRRRPAQTFQPGTGSTSSSRT